MYNVKLYKYPSGWQYRIYSNIVGFNPIDVLGSYAGYTVVLFFAVFAVEFFVSIFLTFWRWLLRVK